MASNLPRVRAALGALLLSCSSSPLDEHPTTTSSATTTTSHTTTNSTSTTTTTTGAGGEAASGGAGGSVEWLDACNPVTNAPCAPGEACDVDANKHVFRCYPPPNTRQACETCGSMDGWCAPTLTCYGGGCAKFCCTSDDCGPLGICNTTLLAVVSNGAVGLCYEPAAGGGAPLPVCSSWPAMAPSGGNCAVVAGTTGGGGAGGQGGTGN